MEFGLDSSSVPAQETADKCTDPQNVAELSDDDITLLSSVHCSVFIQFASSSWFHGDKSRLPKVNFVWPYLLGYRAASVLVRHYAHVLGEWLACIFILILHLN